MPKHARRRDANEPDIVKALEAAGCSVTRLNGKGVPDLLVGVVGETLLVEVKMPLGPNGGLPHQYDGIGGRGDLTQDQVTWIDAWLGKPVAIVRTVAGARALVARARGGAKGSTR